MQDRLSGTTDNQQNHRRLSTQIDLLVIGPKEKTLSRGLSIKLSPPVDQSDDDDELTNKEIPNYYKSGSILSVASSDSVGRSGSNDTRKSFINYDIPIPKPEDRLGEIMKPARDILDGQMPIHRTESRLPSLEGILSDQKLKESLYGDANCSLLDSFANAVTKRTPEAKFKALQDLIRATAEDSRSQPARITPKQLRALLDNVVLFIKQQISKPIDHRRLLFDRKKSASITDSEYKNYLAHPPWEYSIQPWAFVSLGLKLLRNLCVSTEAQEIIFSQGMADILVQRSNLIFTAFSMSTTQDIPPELSLYFNEVAFNLPRALFTFLSNLLTNNDEYRIHCWKIMWPLPYWRFLVLAGEKCFDPFCLLLHNHLTSLLSSYAMQDLSEDLSDSFKELRLELNELRKTEDEADPAFKFDPKQSSFIKFLMGVISIVAIRHRKATTGGSFRKGRLASIQGRVAQATAVAEDWFALFLLRLLSLGKGHALRVLIESVLAHSDERPDNISNQLKLEDKIDYLKNTIGVPETLIDDIVRTHDPNRFLLPGTVSAVEIASILLYAVAEYASIPDEIKSLQMHVDKDTQTQQQTENQRRAEIKLGRKWNLIRRNFLSENITRFILRITTEAIQDFLKITLPTICQADSKFESLQIWTESITAIQEPKLGKSCLTSLIRPLIKCLISLATAPEMAQQWESNSTIDTWDLASALITGIVPFLVEHMAKRNNDHEDDDKYLQILEIMSPRDCLLLLAALGDGYPTVVDRTDIESKNDDDYVHTTRSRSRDDMVYTFPGIRFGLRTSRHSCKTSSCISINFQTLRVITKFSENNSKLVATVKKESTSWESTVKDSWEKTTDFSFDKKI